MDALLPSDVASADAAAEDLLAACVDVAGSGPCLKAAALQGVGGAAAGDDGFQTDDVDDWNLLLDTLDTFEQPPASGHSEEPAATVGTGAIQAGGTGQQQQQRSVQSALQQPGSCVDAVKASAAGGMGDQGGLLAAPVNAIVAVKSDLKHAAPDSCSPAGLPKLGSSTQHKPASAPSATASGEGDSNSAAWHTSCGPDRATARLSWAEDNSPLLAGGAGDGATLSGGNTQSPGSAEGAHSSAGASSRAAAAGAGGGSHTDLQAQREGAQQHHQPAGSSSAADGLRADSAVGVVGGGPGGNMMPPQHPAASAYMGPHMALLGGGHPQGVPHAQQYPGSSSNPRGPFTQAPPPPGPNDYPEPPGFSMFSPQPGLGGMPGGHSVPQHRHLERVINQFAVPGSPIPGSPLSGPVGGAGGPFGLVGAPQARFSHQGRAVVMGAQMQGPRHHPWPPGGPCPCCPPGLPLLPPGSGPMLPSGPRPHLQDLGLGFSGAPLNPDWRPAPHSGPMGLHMDHELVGRSLSGPGSVPQPPFHPMAPMRTSAPGAPTHMQGVPPPGGFMAMLQQQMPPSSGPPPAASFAGGPAGFRGAPAHNNSSGGGAARPAPAAASAAALAPELGDIHPAALSQFGLPEETFPVMVGPAKKKRGRPRKHPLPEVAAASAAIAAAAAAASAAPPGLPHSLGLPGAGPAQQHNLALQQQQLMLQQQHQMQLRMQLQRNQQQQMQLQQQQQRQMMMSTAGPQGWGAPSSQAMAAPPTVLPAGVGGMAGVPSWAAGGGGPDSPFSPGQVVALKRQKSRDFSWGFST